MYVLKYINLYILNNNYLKINIININIFFYSLQEIINIH